MKDLSVALLLDFYGNLLSDKKLFIMEQYYHEDLSLSEIAAVTGMSRQGVHENIQNAASRLKKYEARLSLASRFADITEAAEKIDSVMKPGKLLTEEDCMEIKRLLSVIKNEA